jgi:hypothetical protein
MEEGLGGGETSYKIIALYSKTATDISATLTNDVITITVPRGGKFWLNVYKDESGKEAAFTLIDGW